MTMTDPIADMLTRIRNAQMVKKSEVILPYSKLKFNILTLMAKHGWIESVEKREPIVKGKAKLSKTSHNYIYYRFATLRVKLKYNPDGSPKITSLKRISKPGRRIYVSKNEVVPVLKGKGMAVISTSRGLMTDREARQHKVGGELVCEIY